MEPLRFIHHPWTAQTDVSQVEWEPDIADCYTGPKGGSLNTVPLAKMKQVVRTAKYLTPLFLFALPLLFWKTASKRSHVYAYEDYVVEDSSNCRQQHTLKACRQGTEGSRHRASNEKKQYVFPTYYVLVWISGLILLGAHYRSYKPPSNTLRAKPLYGISHPYIQNALTLISYDFIRRYFHPALNKRDPERRRLL